MNDEMSKKVICCPDYESYYRRLKKDYAKLVEENKTLKNVIKDLSKCL